MAVANLKRAIAGQRAIERVGILINIEFRGIFRRLDANLVADSTARGI